MTDFYTVLRDALDRVGAEDHGHRERIYTHVRTVMVRKLRNHLPRLPAGEIEDRTREFDAAVVQIESEAAVDAAIAPPREAKRPVPEAERNGWEAARANGAGNGPIVADPRTAPPEAESDAVWGSSAIDLAWDQTTEQWHDPSEPPVVVAAPRPGSEWDERLDLALAEEQRFMGREGMTEAPRALNAPQEPALTAPSVKAGARELGGVTTEDRPLPAFVRATPPIDEIAGPRAAPAPARRRRRAIEGDAEDPPWTEQRLDLDFAAAPAVEARAPARPQSRRDERRLGTGKGRGFERAEPPLRSDDRGSMRTEPRAWDDGFDGRDREPALLYLEDARGRVPRTTTPEVDTGVPRGTTGRGVDTGLSVDDFAAAPLRTGRALSWALAILAVGVLAWCAYVFVPLLLPDGSGIETPAAEDGAAATAATENDPIILFAGEDPAVFLGGPDNPVRFQLDPDGGFVRIVSSAAGGARAVIGPGVAERLGGHRIRVSLDVRAAPGRDPATLRLGYQRGGEILEWRTVGLSSGFVPTRVEWLIPAGPGTAADHLVIEPGVPGDGTAADIRRLTVEVVE